MAILLVFVLFGFLVFGMPMYVAVASSTLVALQFTQATPMVIVTRMFGGLDRFALMAIPFFILAAQVMRYGGMARRLINMSEALVGRFAGGLALATILACMFFGAICGSAAATLAAIGGIVFEGLVLNNYGKGFSTGLITSSSCVSLLIPPSVTMIIYAAVSGTSVGALFIAGFGAGMVYALVYAGYSFYYGSKHRAVSSKGKNLREVLVQVKNALWDMGVGVIIMGGIYSGVFTPTEAAAVSAVYAIFVCTVIHRELDFRGLCRAASEAATFTAMVMMMIAAASALSWLLVVGGIPQAFAELVLTTTSSPSLALMMMVSAMLVAGMFMDGSCFILILVPIFGPIVATMGIDFVHFGIVTVLMGAIGMFTPPFGLNIFVAMGITKSKFEEVVSAMWPFIGLSLIIAATIMYFPQISLWLPNILMAR